MIEGSRLLRRLQGPDMAGTMQALCNTTMDPSQCRNPQAFMVSRIHESLDAVQKGAFGSFLEAEDAMQLDPVVWEPFKSLCREQDRAILELLHRDVLKVLQALQPDAAVRAFQHLRTFDWATVTGSAKAFAIEQMLLQPMIERERDWSIGTLDSRVYDAL